jgi:fluoroquinolone transport system permease protein
MRQLILLSITDFKLIFRDPSLRIFLAMPLLIFILVLVALPLLVDSYAGVAKYVPIVLMGATVQTSTMFGFIYSMVLVHEKDIQVAKVYGVLPVSKIGFVASRLLIPFIISTVTTFFLLVVQPFYSFSLLPMVLLAILCGLLAPLLTLLVSIFSKNKMEGMTWFKLVNFLISVPLAAFFTSKYAAFFGIIPSHWAFQTLDKMILGEDYFLPVFIGIAFISTLLILMGKRFARVHFL